MAPLAERKDTISQVLTSSSLLGVFSYMGIPSIFHHHKSVVYPFHNLFVSFLVIITTIAFNYKVQSETSKISRFNSHVFPFHTSHKRIWSNLQLDRGFPPPRYISVNWPPLLYCVYYYSTRKS